MIRKLCVLCFSVTVSDMSQLNLDNFNVHCVAGALKKYLRELPNPVIPVEMYSQFIDAASKFSSTFVFLVCFPSL